MITSACSTSARPGVREAHAAAAAIHERGARVLLERRDLLRDGGLRIGERVGGGRERTVLRNGLKDPQLLDVEHNYELIAAHSSLNLNLWPALPIIIREQIET